MAPDAEFFKPGKDISWLVKQFETINYNSKRKLIDKFVPRDDAALVYNFGNLPVLLSPIEQQLPRFFIAPLCPTANTIMIKGVTDSFIVICKPSVLSRLPGVSMIPGNEVFIPLPEPVFGPLWDIMSRQSSAAERIKVFSEFIRALNPCKYIPDETDLIYEAIINSSIATPLHEILSQFPVSERTVQRRFRERLGISPKMLSRIVKINHLWNRISSNMKMDYQDLVFMGNYFDQTHFIKDFKAITGETPDRFFKRDLRVARIMSGKE